MNISEETIDSYLRGDLSGSDLEAFKSTVGSDPGLKQEIDFQQDIVNSLKQYRHQQLKSRFNSVEIPASGLNNSVFLKFAASIGIVAILIGSFVVWEQQQKHIAVDSIPKTSVPETASANNTTVYSTKTASAKPQAKETSSAKNTVTTPAESNKKGTVSNDVFSEEIATEQYSPEAINRDFNMPEINDHTSNSTIQDVKVNIIKEKSLGYRFFNNQLFLHGNFSNSPYELFELNSTPDKQLYLYFETNYYELLQGKTKITALNPITDSNTLIQLNQLRER